MSRLMSLSAYNHKHLQKMFCGEGARRCGPWWSHESCCLFVSGVVQWQQQVAVVVAFVSQHRWAPAGGISVHVTPIAAHAAAINWGLLTAAVHPKAGAGRFTLLAQH